MKHTLMIASATAALLFAAPANAQRDLTKPGSQPIAKEVTQPAALALPASISKPAPVTQSDTDWGDGAAYGGGRIIQGNTSGGTASAPALTVAASTSAVTPAPITAQRGAAGRYTFGGSHSCEGGVAAGCDLGSPVIRANNPVDSQLPQARSGECFARIIVPAEFRTDSREVVVQDAHRTLSVSEPKFEPDTTRVKIRDEYVKYKIRQPRWEVETEDVLVRPEYKRLTVQPAQWNFIDETVEVSEPRLVWKPGTASSTGITRTDPKTGAIYCLIEEGSETRTFRKRVMSAPEQITERIVPPQYVTVTKRILTDAGGVDKENIPAEFTVLKTQRLTVPALPQETKMPARTERLETKVMTSPERYEWAPVLCGNRLTQTSVSTIQSKLKQAGHYDGAVDGEIGPMTKIAVRAFQRAENIPHGGELTFATLDKLGAGSLAR